MERIYLEFSSLPAAPPTLNASLLISSILEEPYTLVASLLNNQTAPHNLTYLPETDSAAEDEQVFVYFVIAIILVLVVIGAFVKSTPEGRSNKYQYNALPLRSSEVLVLEEEDLQDLHS